MKLGYILQDYPCNKGNFKIVIVLILFRISQLVGNSNILIYTLSIPYLILYRIWVEWILGIELHWKLEVGSGLTIHHGYGLVVNPTTKIGRGCVLRHLTTFGSKLNVESGKMESPIIEDYVDVGPHVVIIGPVRIGSNSKIGAGSVVVKDVPPFSIVAGNPARVIGSVENEQAL